jgi:hypothetical protein
MSSATSRALLIDVRAREFFVQAGLRRLGDQR